MKEAFLVKEDHPAWSITWSTFLSTHGTHQDSHMKNGRYTSDQRVIKLEMWRSVMRVGLKRRKTMTYRGLTGRIGGAFIGSTHLHAFATDHLWKCVSLPLRSVNWSRQTRAVWEVRFYLLSFQDPPSKPRATWVDWLKIRLSELGSMSLVDWLTPKVKHAKALALSSILWQRMTGLVSWIPTKTHPEAGCKIWRPIARAPLNFPSPSSSKTWPANTPFSAAQSPFLHQKRPMKKPPFSVAARSASTRLHHSTKEGSGPYNAIEWVYLSVYISMYCVWMKNLPSNFFVTFFEMFV